MKCNVAGSNGVPAHTPCREVLQHNNEWVSLPVSPPTPTFIDVCLPVFISDICTRGAVSFRNTLLLPFYLLVFDIPAAGVLAGALHRFYLLREVVSSSLRSFNR